MSISIMAVGLPTGAFFQFYEQEEPAVIFSHKMGDHFEAVTYSGPSVVYCIIDIKSLVCVASTFTPNYVDFISDSVHSMKATINWHVCNICPHIGLWVVSMTSIKN